MEEQKDPCDTEHKGFQETWRHLDNRVSFWGEGKSPGFVGRKAGNCTQTLIKLGLLLLGSQYLPEGRREAAAF